MILFQLAMMGSFIAQRGVCFGTNYKIEIEHIFFGLKKNLLLRFFGVCCYNYVQNCNLKCIRLLFD